MASSTNISPRNSRALEDRTEALVGKGQDAGKPSGSGEVSPGSSSHDMDGKGQMEEKKVFQGRLDLLRFSWPAFVALVTPFIALALMSSHLLSSDEKTYKLGGGGFTMLVMAVYWILEIIPLGATGLIPVFAGPLFDLVSSETIVREFLKDIMFLFVTGIAVAFAFEFSNLHKRLALKVILLVGTSPKMLLLGVVVVTALLSPFMNNTSVTAMMIPIVLAVVDSLRESMSKFIGEITLPPSHVDSEMNAKASEQESKVEDVTKFNSAINDPVTSGDNVSISSPPVPPAKDQAGANYEFERRILEERRASESADLERFLGNTRTMLLLGACWSSSISGTALIVGTGTNLLLITEAAKVKPPVLPENDGDNADYEFVTWFRFAIVPAILNMIFLYFFLYVWFLKIKPRCGISKGPTKGRKGSFGFKVTKEVTLAVKAGLEENYKELGPISLHEILSATFFGILVALWLFLNPRVFPGWQSFFPLTKPSNSTPAIMICILCFMVPRKREFYVAIWRRDWKNAKFETVLEWQPLTSNFPYAVILLLGGSFAFSTIARNSGMNEVIKNSFLSPLTSLPPNILLLIVILLSAVLTQFVSNTASGSIMLNTLFLLSREMRIHPLYLTFPATIIASLGFMMPVSTPPNALVFNAGHMKVSDMAIPGIFLTICTCFIVYGTVITYGTTVYNFNDYKPLFSISKSELLELNDRKAAA